METPATPPYDTKRFDSSFLSKESCELSMPSPPDLSNEEECLYKSRKKSAPYRSPPPDQIHDKSIIFQLDSYNRSPRIVYGSSLLWPVRRRVLKARMDPVQRVKPVKIMIPKLQTVLLPDREQEPVRRKYSQPHSGRPSRIKGPCQACRETSDGCMRKAFNWPFPTDNEFSDKGKPFVYLCNKCGLRYNKSGGCVCRHCRWVLCKEEKRKAMQHIDSMRVFRPDRKINLEDDIENFVCNPKYWPCGHTWKVGWILQSQNAEEEDSSSDDTL